MTTFAELFPKKKTILGMIHLAGDSSSEKVKRALEELLLYESEGVDGAIIEDYHGEMNDVRETLKQSQRLNMKIVRGVNLLRNPYQSFVIAHEYGAQFIQLDSVQDEHLFMAQYSAKRHEYQDLVVLGGVGFKYQSASKLPLGVALRQARTRCEVIVTTGSGTGIETPLEKLYDYKAYLCEFPLIVGAGVTAQNVHQQLLIADGAIIGSYFKKSDPSKSSAGTYGKVIRERVKEIMSVAEKLCS
jgi:uncharacterized protein